jgi:hypothetical protein
MTPQAQAMEDAITKLEGNEAAVEVIVGEMAKWIAAHKDDPAALQAFADRVSASGDKLGTLKDTISDPDTTD